MKAIADTGFLVALLNRRDQYHDWAQTLMAGLTPPLVTCDAVLTETTFHIGDARAALQMIDRGLVKATPVLEEWPRLLELAERYSDRRPDLADLCLIRLSELYPKYPVITTDVADFRVYRRGRREIIPLLTPSALR